MLLLRGQQPAVLNGCLEKKDKKKELQLQENDFVWVLPGVIPCKELTLGHYGILTWPASICHWLLVYIQTWRSASGWTSPVTDRIFLVLSAKLIVTVTQRSRCQPKSMSVIGLVPVPKCCHHRTKQSLEVPSWTLFCWLPWNPCSWRRFFHWLHGLLLCFSLTGMFKCFYCFPISFSIKLETAMLELGKKKKKDFFTPTFSL